MLKQLYQKSLHNLPRTAALRVFRLKVLALTLVMMVLLAAPVPAEAWGYAEYNGLVHRSGRVIPLPDGYVLEADPDGPTLENDPREGFQEGLIPVRETDSGLYGYMNMEGEIVIAPQFTLAQPFSEGLAAVALDEWFQQWGWINPQGKMVIEPIYDAGGSFREGAAWASVYLGETLAEDPAYGFLRPDGSLLTHFKYYLAGDFREGMAPVCELLQWGFVNLEGEEIVPPQYDWVSSFVEGVAVVRLYDSHGLVNRQGDLLWLKDYDTLSDFYEGYGVASRGEDHCIVTLDGREIPLEPPIQGLLYFNADRGEGFRYGMLPVIAADGTQGYADLSGRLVISGPYEQVFGFRNGLSGVMMFTDETSQINHEQFQQVVGFIDLEGAMVIDPVFPMAGSYNEGLCPVMNTERRWGAINMWGQWVIDPVFLEMGAFVSDYAPVVLPPDWVAAASVTVTPDTTNRSDEENEKNEGNDVDIGNETANNHSLTKQSGLVGWLIPGLVLMVLVTGTGMWLKRKS
ncbi:WG repeat-containing protein [Anoxynatronum buryatiense]|uniref:WG containing repeat-containing protein n=1 Tax=Anoxynatronum buryatiense TaxID=489973 RepID=A0AA45WV65_9CLOT|nr:WG repeat-containing protein [Anoxynatronum buryatiense]SMP51403.1 WG containing repeat-containing protein [Anoxynatronum buryatiense]